MEEQTTNIPMSDRTELGQSRDNPDIKRKPANTTVCVLGMGYVGLPLAVEFDTEGCNVIGYDVDTEKINTLESGIDPTGDVGNVAIEDSEIKFTASEADIGDAEYILIAVPTPVDDLKNPNLRYVESAGKALGEHIQKGTTVVLESTVFPGATRKRLGPAIEETSGLVAEEDFKLAYSPERLVPGNPERGLKDVAKIVGAQDKKTLAEVAELYELVVDASVHRAPTIEVAETAKCIENTQRDINIALMNELAIACENLGIDTNAVLEAAGTKWNFHEYYPGLVGGHCIPVDPFFLVYQSEQNGFSPELIRKAREVNEYIPEHVANLTIKGLNEGGNILGESRILVLGLTFKPNVEDIRTSAITGVIEKLREFNVKIVGYDPYANNDEIRNEFGILVQDELSFANFDGVIVGAAHDEFRNIEVESINQAMNENPVIVDTDRLFDKAETDEFIHKRL